MTNRPPIPEHLLPPVPQDPQALNDEVSCSQCRKTLGLVTRS